MVVKEETKKFKFGNGGTQRAASFVELPQVIGGTKVALGVHAIDAPGVPLLLSVRTLRRMGAVIDTERNMMQLRKFSEEWIQLKQSSNEHLLLDMTCDWYHPMPNSASTTAGAYMERSCSTYPHAPHAHDLEPHDFVCAPSHGQEHSELCDSHVFERVSSCPIESKPHFSAEQTCLTTSPTPDATGSSMPSVAKALTTLAAATRALHPVLHGYGHSGSHPYEGGIGVSSKHWDAGKPLDDFDYKFQASAEVQKRQNPDSREVRHDQNYWSSSRRSKESGISVLWQSYPDGTRERVPDGTKQVWNVDLLRDLQAADLLHPSLRGNSTAPTSRTTTCGCHHDHRAARTPEDQGGSHVPRAAQCQVGGLQRGRGFVASPLEGDRRVQEEESTAATTRCSEGHRDAIGPCLFGSKGSSGDTRAEEVHQEGERPDSRARGMVLGEGAGFARAGISRQGVDDFIPENVMKPIIEPLENLIQDDEKYQNGRCGFLTDSQRTQLCLCAEEFLEEAHSAWQDILPPEDGIDLMEICCPPDSRLTQTFLDRGRKAIRVGLPAHNIATSKGVQEIKNMITRWKPKLTWFSLPCGPFSPIQELFNEKDDLAKAKSMERKQKAKKMIKNGLDIATHQLQQGRDVAWEWPSNNRGWNLQLVRQFWSRLEQTGDLHCGHANGCAFGLREEKSGLPIRKPWLIKTTSKVVARAVSRTCPGTAVHPHHHECVGGSVARNSGFYPSALCDVIFKAVKEMDMAEANSVIPACAYPVFGTGDMAPEKPT